MENSSCNSVNTAKASFFGLSGYFKLDLPTGKDQLPTGEATVCRCGKSTNKPYCDESHAKCVDEMICPWF